jgi:hypothetical protein
LGGDVHLQPGRLGDGLLALQRLPQDIVRDGRVALWMAGNPDALDPGVVNAGLGIAMSPATSSTCCTPAAARTRRRSRSRFASTTRRAMTCGEAESPSSWRRNATRTTSSGEVFGVFATYTGKPAGRMRASSSRYFSSCGVTSVEPPATKLRIC